ncbi:MAG TPA: hypothetical protein VM051_14070 [Usitatibacter sp.]|nr:hypothetical protein [Usitatibacter sp.]
MSDESKGNTRELAIGQVERVSGGTCTAAEAEKLLANIQDSYEQLIEFTTYVMERVSGTPPAQP